MKVMEGRRQDHRREGKPGQHVREGDALSPSQGEVLHLVSLGLSNGEIGESLGISIKTVEAHLAVCRLKSGIQSRVLLAFWWRDNREEHVHRIAERVLRRRRAYRQEGGPERV